MRKLTRSIGNTIFENLGRAAGRVQENKPLPVDVLESEDEYLVVFDAPGATASDVQVRYVDDRVEVRIDRFRDFYDGFEMLFPGRGLTLDGRASLPDDAVVDAADATATLRPDGTLQVRVPKGAPPSGLGGEGVDDRIDDTVEEADEREDAGAAVGDDGSDGGNGSGGDADDDRASDGGRQDETDAEEESEAGEGTDDGDDRDGDAISSEDWGQDETDMERDSGEEEGDEDAEE